MEMGESSEKKVPWVPTTPVKPILARPVPIYAAEEGNHLNQTNFLQTSPCVSPQDWYANRLVACEGVNMKIQDSTVTSIGCDSVGTSVKPTLDNISSLEHLGFADLLALANNASLNFTANGVKNPFTPVSKSQSDPVLNLTSTILSNHNDSFEPTSIITFNGCPQQPQGAYPGCRETISQFAPPTPDKAIGGESRQVPRMQIIVEEEKNVPCTKHCNNEIPSNLELSEATIESSLAAVPTPLKENHNADKGGSHGFDLNEPPIPKQRRKKHRPKVITEGKPRQIRKQVTPKPLQSNEKPTTKRTYVRRKVLNKTSATPPTEVTGESTEPVNPEPTRKSCRRSLNFETGEQPRDQNPAPGENITAHLGNVVDVVVDKALVAPGTYLSNVNSPGTKPNASSIRDSKRKDLVTGQDGHEKTVLQSGQTDSNSCHSRNLTTGLHMGVTKRKYSTTTEHTDTSSMNQIGSQFNDLQAYHTLCLVQFPNIRKKRRSEKGPSPTSIASSFCPTKDVSFTSYSQVDTRAHLHPSSSKCLVSCEYKAVEVPVTFEPTEGIFPLYQTTPTKRRSRVQTKLRDLAPFTTTRNLNILPNHFIKQLNNCNGKAYEDAERPVIVAETCASLPKKKRTTRKKTNTPVGSAHPSTYQMQEQHKFLLFNSDHKSLANSLVNAGDMHQVTWNLHPMDDLADKFSHLDINKEVKDNASHERNALVPYYQQNQKDKTTVEGDGTIIPFEGPFDPIRRRRPRPKVDLDQETDKVWKLLMLDINSHGIDGTDEEKAKWWEEERKVFTGRADSFIARMRLVQGDRRFSRWKGSVVDSVIGVFLTQNVSDHLSSSAFMTLAARFPLKTSDQYHEEGTSLVADEPQVLMVEPERNTKWDDNILNQSFVTVEHPEEEVAVNDNEALRTTGSITSLTDESNCKLLKSDEGNTTEHSSMSRQTGTVSSQEGQENPCCRETNMELIDRVSSQCSVFSSQLSGDVSIDQNPEKIGSCSDSNSEVEDLSNIAMYNITDNRTCFSKLLEMANSIMLHEVNSQRIKSWDNPKEAFDQSIGIKHDHQPIDLEKSDLIQGSLEASITHSSEHTLKLTPNSGVLEVHSFDRIKTKVPLSDFSNNKDENNINRSCSHTRESASQGAICHSESVPSQLCLKEQNSMVQQNCLHSSAQTQDLMQSATESNSGDQNYAVRNITTETNDSTPKPKGRKTGKEKKQQVNWDNLRIRAQLKAGKREQTVNTMDSLDWDAVRRANVSEIADTIKERGMNNRLAERIKDFLNRLVEEHGGIDLEWLRDVPPDQAKEYLLSIRGLGLKSVECVRLLTLHHLAFPVDTNVGRIAVRLGWVPLQPLPESLQLHLLELYPVLETIQKYLWPRLCKLDQRTLYELHYQMITFGKVFCTKSKPNCNACPMRGECRHFASAFASARLALPAPEERSIVSTAGNMSLQNSSAIIGQLPLPLPEHTGQTEETQQKQLEVKSDFNICQPIIEEPATPETECTQALENDIEDAFYDDSCEIPTIKLNIEEFTLNLQNYMQGNMELQEEMSKALVALTPEAASIPTPKLKNVSRLRTEHCVYELPDSHPLLEGWDKREPDDPCKYLLAIWTPGETATSIQPPESRCSYQEYGQLCNEKECFSCNSVREANSQIVRGTILIPCRTAMRGSFPLNGTYFQVNEVFADHDSSLDPINVPRSWIWNLNRRTVFFGTSIPSIFKGLTTQEIQQCFWKGYVCVRGFHREARAPRPLLARLHFPASKMVKVKEKTSSM